jgi:hypothetical protein
MADQLVTPSELASFLQKDVDTATATLLIELATGKVQGAAGQRLVAATSTFVIDVDLCSGYEPYLALPQSPVRSVASVEIDGATTTDWLLRSQKLWRLNGWNTNSSAPTQVTAVGVAHGYLDGSQMLELARSYVFGLCAMPYETGGAAVQSEQIDDYRVTYAQADAAMVVTPAMKDQLIKAYGTSAYVTSSR